MARTVTATWSTAGVAAACILALAVPAAGQSLQGSKLSLDLQNRMAAEHDFTYIGTSAQVRRFVDAGYLVPVRSNRDYRVKTLPFPYTRPEVALFLSRLGRQYRAACGEQLVVTSLTRPSTRQPRNASPRSVHPTGMAVDLRRSGKRACRAWLERVLTQLEGRGVLDAVRERRPPHYHVAVFPRQYAAYVKSLGGTVATTTYRVRNGDSLWTIAERHGTTVEQLRTANNLRGSRIYAGQVLSLPASP